MSARHQATRGAFSPRAPRPTLKPKSFNELVAEWASLQAPYKVALKEQGALEQAWFDDKSDAAKKAAARRAETAAGRIESKVVAIERRIIATPAPTLAYLVQKIDIVLNFDLAEKDAVLEEIKPWLIAAQAAVSTAPSPELVALAERLCAGVRQYDSHEYVSVPEEIAERLYEDNKVLWSIIERFPPRNVADVVVKSRTAEIFYGEPTGENTDAPTAADRIVQIMRADLERLAGTKLSEAAMPALVAAE